MTCTGIFGNKVNIRNLFLQRTGQPTNIQAGPTFEKRAHTSPLEGLQLFSQDTVLPPSTAELPQITALVGGTATLTEDKLWEVLAP